MRVRYIFIMLCLHSPYREQIFHSLLLVTKQPVSLITWVMDSRSLYVLLLDFPADSKTEDLLTLTGKEIDSVPDEKMEHQGSSLLKEHQHLMLQHFGSKEMSILPDHVIHRMLVGVSVYLRCSLNFGSPFGISFFFSHYPSFSLFFQSTRTL